MRSLADLQAALNEHVSHLYDKLIVTHQEITLECTPEQYFPLMTLLRDHDALRFEQLIDLCGVDYLTYQNQERHDKRFAVVCHLLSISQNSRLRVRVFIQNEEMPAVPSIIEIYNAADWYEREAFDLYGIIFENHPDLRRILTDYGFVGHPFRKDFPVTGYMEMAYDEGEKRVIYQPVTIEPREVTPRIVREEHYGGH